MEKRKTYIAVTVLFAAYIIAVLCLCLLNLSSTTQNLSFTFLGIPSDKIAHYLMYMAYPVVGWLFLSYNRRLRIRPQYIYTTLAITGIVFSALTEALQTLLTTYRTTEALDLLANVLGILTGTLLMWIFRKPATKVCDAAQAYMHNLIYNRVGGKQK